MEELMIILRVINSTCVCVCVFYNSENVPTIIIMTLLIIISLNQSVIKEQIKNNNNNQTNAHPKAVFIIAHKKESFRGHVEELEWSSLPPSLCLWLSSFLGALSSSRSKLHLQPPCKPPVLHSHTGPSSSLESVGMWNYRLTLVK